MGHERPERRDGELEVKEGRRISLGKASRGDPWTVLKAQRVL